MLSSSSRSKAEKVASKLSRTLTLKSNLIFEFGTGTLAAFVAAEDDGFEDEPLVIETVTEIDLSDHSLHQSLDDDASDDDAERLSPAHADLSYASDPRDEAGLVTPPPPDLV